MFGYAPEVCSPTVYLMIATHLAVYVPTPFFYFYFILILILPPKKKIVRRLHKKIWSRAIKNKGERPRSHGETVHFTGLRLE